MRVGSSVRVGSRCEWVRRGSSMRVGSSGFVGVSGFVKLHRCEWVRGATIYLLSLSLSSRVVQKWRDDLDDRWLGLTRVGLNDRSGAIVLLQRQRSSCSFSLSLSSIFQGRKSFEVKMKTEMIFHCFGSHFQSTGNTFQLDQIWSNNQTPNFPENHFRNQFGVNSNAALV